MIRLFREIRWVNSFRAGADAKNPVLLAPMQALLSRSSSMSAVDGFDALDPGFDRHPPRREPRHLALISSACWSFWACLGTFWGLLQTIGSIGDTIQSLDVGSGDTGEVLDSLKLGLSAPLAGMGTAFSSSLFGLAGSLVLGFLDLQAGRAQNRFYTELEKLAVDRHRPELRDPCRRRARRLDGGDQGAGRKVALDAGDRAAASANPRVASAMASLAEGISGLVKNMRSEQQLMRDWVEAQEPPSRNRCAPRWKNVTAVLDKESKK